MNVLVICALKTIVTRKSSCGKPQEAYHPRHNLSQHNLSEGGVPHPWPGSTPSWGTQHPDLARGVPHPWLRGLPPLWGTPILTWLENPIFSQGVPGIPSHPDLGPVTGVPSQKGHGTSGSIMGWRWGPPLERTWNQWKYYGMEMEITDRHQLKHNLPSYYVHGR